MNILLKGLLTPSLSAALLLVFTVSFAEDWTISAIGSCEAGLGEVTSGGGIKANGGTAVVRCPLTKERWAKTGTVMNGTKLSYSTI